MPPDTPDFEWEPLDSENSYARVKVYWYPNIAGNLGSQFFVKYRIKGLTTWLQTDEVLDDDYVDVRDLEPDMIYEFVVASIDGDFLTESFIKEVHTPSY